MGNQEGCQARMASRDQARSIKAPASRVSRYDAVDGEEETSMTTTKTNSSSRSAIDISPLIRVLAKILVEQAAQEHRVADNPPREQNQSSCEH